MGQSLRQPPTARGRKTSLGSPRTRSLNSRRISATGHRSLTLNTFKTSLGWIGAVGTGGKLVSLTVGHPSQVAARTAAMDQIEEGELGILDDEVNWCPALQKRFVDYAAGKRVTFDDIPLALPELTDFQRRVLDQTRKIGYGEKLAYGELALRAGFPRAARGVGTVMSRNRFPVIIPCHRVVASQGKLGGYSSPQGICLKERLLTLEARGED